MEKKVQEKAVHLGNGGTIDAGIGSIRWQSNNLQLIAIMEALTEKLKTKSPNEICAHIEAM